MLEVCGQKDVLTKNHFRLDTSTWVIRLEKLLWEIIGKSSINSPVKKLNWKSIIRLKTFITEHSFPNSPLLPLQLFLKIVNISGCIFILRKIWSVSNALFKISDKTPLPSSATFWSDYPVILRLPGSCNYGRRIHSCALG